MVKKGNTSISRRDILKIGGSLLALGGLAACGTPAATPAPTAAPSATTAPTTNAAESTATSAPTSAPAEPTAAPAESTATTPASETSTATSGQVTVYQIDPSRSEARFTLDEKLMGNPKTVVGTTSKVSGTISVTHDNPANTQIGVIQIDASDFSTDSNMRNGAIQRFILQTTQPEFQYITFEPTAIEGLPAQAVSAGGTVSFKVTGNLKIRNVVKPVTFDTTVTLPTEGELSGSAKATVTRSAFELTIPSVPSVADVTEEVALELEFVAAKQ